MDVAGWLLGAVSLVVCVPVFAPAQAQGRPARLSAAQAARSLLSAARLVAPVSPINTTIGAAINLPLTAVETTAIRVIGAQVGPARFVVAPSSLRGSGATSCVAPAPSWERL